MLSKELEASKSLVKTQKVKNEAMQAALRTAKTADHKKLESRIAKEHEEEVAKYKKQMAAEHLAEIQRLRESHAKILKANTEVISAMEFKLEKSKEELEKARFTVHKRELRLNKQQQGYMTEAQRGKSENLHFSKSRESSTKRASSPKVETLEVDQEMTHSAEKKTLNKTNFNKRTELNEQDMMDNANTSNQFTILQNKVKSLEEENIRATESHEVEIQTLREQHEIHHSEMLEIIRRMEMEHAKAIIKVQSEFKNDNGGLYENENFSKSNYEMDLQIAVREADVLREQVKALRRRLMETTSSHKAKKLPNVTNKKLSNMDRSRNSQISISAHPEQASLFVVNSVADFGRKSEKYGRSALDFENEKSKDSSEFTHHAENMETDTISPTFPSSNNNFQSQITENSVNLKSNLNMVAYQDQVTTQRVDESDQHVGTFSSNWYEQDPTSSDSIASMMARMENLSTFPKSMPTLVPISYAHKNGTHEPTMTAFQLDSLPEYSRSSPPRTLNHKSIFSPDDPFSNI